MKRLWDKIFLESRKQGPFKIFSSKKNSQFEMSPHDQQKILDHGYCTWLEAVSCWMSFRKFSLLSINDRNLFTVCLPEKNRSISKKDSKWKESVLPRLLKKGTMVNTSKYLKVFWKMSAWLLLIFLIISFATSSCIGWIESWGKKILWRFGHRWKIIQNIPSELFALWLVTSQ